MKHFCGYADDQLLQWAIDNPENLYEEGCDGDTVLRHAIKRNNVGMVNFFLNDLNIRPSYYDLRCTSNVHILNLLLTKIDPAGDVGGYTVLMRNVSSGNIPAIKALLRFPRVKERINESCNATCDCGGYAATLETVLHVACNVVHSNMTARKRFDVIELLLKEGADPTVRCRETGRIPADLLPHDTNRKAHKLLRKSILIHDRAAAARGALTAMA